MKTLLQTLFPLRAFLLFCVSVVILFGLFIAACAPPNPVDIPEELSSSVGERGTSRPVPVPDMEVEEPSQPISNPVEPCIDDDGDGYGVGEHCLGADCDDQSAEVHPEALEIPADGVDQDCDAKELCFEDADGDGIGGARLVRDADADLSCETGVGVSLFDTDCDDVDLHHWSDCFTACSIEDVDGDHRGVACDLGPDCDETDSEHWSDCGTCVDLDGDAHGEGCDLGPDCDDQDPTIYAGAPEVPQDGWVQDCGNADLQLSNATAVFVAPPPLGREQNPGTQDAPLASIHAAMLAAVDQRRGHVAVAAGRFDETVVSHVSLHGGFDPNTWQRNIHGSRTDIVTAADVAILVPPDTQAVLSGLTVSGLAGAFDETVGVLVSEGSQATLVQMKVDGGNGVEKTSAVLSRGKTFVSRSLLTADSESGVAVGLHATGSESWVVNTVVFVGSGAEAVGGEIGGEGQHRWVNDTVLARANSGRFVGVRMAEAPRV